MGFSQAYARVVADWALGSGDHIAYSTTGSSETSIMARTAIGSWSAATNASPTEKSNGSQLTSASATGSGQITHIAVFSAASGGTQKTEWTAVHEPRDVVAGDQVTFAVGDAKFTLD